MIGFSHHARDLAAHVRVLGQFANLRGPWFQEPLSDQRFGDVVEHKGLLRESCHQFQGGRELLRINENVVGESELAEGPNALEYRRAD